MLFSNNFKRRALITFSILTLAMFFYVIIIKADYSELFRANILFVTISLVTVILSIVLSALRFSILTGIELKEAVSVWFTSQFVSNITPTHSGGELVRIYVGYRRLRSFYKPLLVVLSEIYGDVIVPNSVALFYSIYNLLVLRINIFMITAVASAYNIVLWSLIVFKKKFLKKMILKIFSKLRVNINDEPHLAIKEGVFMKNLLLSTVFSFIKLVLMGFSVFFSYVSVSEKISFLNSLLAYSLGMALGIVPLPAGVGGIEAGFSLIKPGVGVVMWRIVSYYVATFLMLPFTLTLIHKKIIS